MHLKRILFLLLISVCSLLAQDSIRVDFRMLALGSPLKDLAVVGIEGLVDVEEVPSFDRSKVFTYKGGSKLRFIRNDQYVVDGPLPKSLFEVNMSTDIKNPLLIVAAAPEGAPFPYQVMVLPDNLKDLPGGSSYFINASPYPIAVIFDQEKEPVKMRPKAAVKRSFDEGAHNIRVRIASYAEGEVRKGLDSRIYPLPIHRDIYFIYARNGAEAGRLMIRRLREHEEVAKRYIQKAAQEE
jgi:hypothetical protein